jgi:hypothetical protein
MAAVLMTVLVGASSSDIARADDPDFSNVPDILNGRRHLLRVDDLALAGAWNPNGDALGALLQTSDSTITQATSSHLNAKPGLGTGDCIGSNQLNSVAAGGRMFNLGHDVVLSAVAVNDTLKGVFCQAVAFLDPDSLPIQADNPGVFGLDFSGVITQVYAVVADFTGMGTMRWS